jgi:hypothetical protein
MQRFPIARPTKKTTLPKETVAFATHHRYRHPQQETQDDSIGRTLPQYTQPNPSANHYTRGHTGLHRHLQQHTNQHITARNASCRKFPIEMLNAVLNMNTGKLMEMRHLLVNPKYKDLWGKSYTKELGRLAQGVPGVTSTNTIIFVQRNEVPLERIKDETMDRYALIIAPKKMTQITRNSQWEEVISIIQATVARQLLTW